MLIIGLNLYSAHFHTKPNFFLIKYDRKAVSITHHRDMRSQLAFASIWDNTKNLGNFFSTDLLYWIIRTVVIGGVIFSIPKITGQTVNTDMKMGIWTFLMSALIIRDGFTTTKETSKEIGRTFKESVKMLTNSNEKIAMVLGASFTIGFIFMGYFSDKK